MRVTVAVAAFLTSQLRGTASKKTSSTPAVPLIAPRKSILAVAVSTVYRCAPVRYPKPLGLKALQEAPSQQRLRPRARILNGFFPPVQVSDFYAPLK
ncbi:hypothetical protein V5799_013583 [Amblyomma americanum]|uniref:Uncharacterized protein n=1 Tax=Amblyomma americanum TaxID=6943 RepID=A0AAQ4E5M5_AMBAM